MREKLLRVALKRLLKRARSEKCKACGGLKEVGLAIPGMERPCPDCTELVGCPHADGAEERWIRSEPCVSSAGPVPAGDGGLRQFLDDLVCSYDCSTESELPAWASAIYERARAALKEQADD